MQILFYLIIITALTIGFLGVFGAFDSKKRIQRY